MVRGKAKAENKVRKITHEMNYYLKHGYALSVCKKGCKLHKKRTVRRKKK